MIGIYKITSPSGKIYIGQSSDIEKRLNLYRLGHCKKQFMLYNSIKKYGFGLYTDATAKLNIYRNGGGNIISTSANPFLVNVWNNIVITSTAVGTTNIYVNNVLKLTGSTLIASNTSTFKIGWDVTYFGNFLIKNVLIYNEILDSDRIKLLNDTN